MPARRARCSTFSICNARLDRYQIVANKALTQTIGHLLKLVYYGGVIGVTGDGVDPLFLGLAVLAAVLGTRAGTRLLDRVGDGEFRRVSRYVILAIGAVLHRRRLDETVA